MNPRARKSACALFLAVSVAACAAAPPPTPRAKPTAAVADALPETPDAPFRASRPPSGPAPLFSPPAIARFALENGVPVYVVEQHDLPVVAVDVVVRGGTSALPVREFWTARASADLMVKGAGGRDALAMSDALAALGAELTVSAGFDYARAALQLPSARLAEALALMGDAVVRPTFAEAEIALVRETLRASHQKLASDRETVAWNVLERAVYGEGHPYGHAYVAEPSELAAIDRRGLRAAHALLFARERAAIVVAGDVNPATLLPALEAAFGGWRPSGVSAEVRPVPAPPPRKGSRIALVDVPGAAQSLVFVAEASLPAASADRDAFHVMNTVLGGTWMSRLNANLREGKGYSYWVNSGYFARRFGGRFRAGGAIQKDKTADSVKEILGEVRAMREREVTALELEGAKTLTLSRRRAPFDRVEATTESLSFLFGLALPMDDWATDEARISKVTGADVLRVARAHLHPEATWILVVGDRTSIEPALVGLGLGPIELRDARGAVVSADK